MKTGKHFKFINSNTGYAIYYYSVSDDMETGQVRIELEKVKAQVASNNGLLINTVYWEEIKADNTDNTEQ